MIIINAEFSAGMTIEEAIAEALDFSEKHHCIIRCKINDVDMSIVAGLLPKNEAVKYYVYQYIEMGKYQKEGENDGQGKA